MTRTAKSLLPRALHPTIPATVIFTAARYPDSPVGPFMLAQVRVGCRAAALPRGFLLRAYTDSAAAADALGAALGLFVRRRRREDRLATTIASSAT